MGKGIFIKFISALSLSYLIGSLPTSYLLGKWTKGIDIRSYGSGNVGFTNLCRIAGLKPGIIALFVDVLKGLIPVLAGYYLFDASSKTDIIVIFLGIAAIIGHNWSIFLKGKGGKGVATSTGVFLGLLPIPTLFAFIIFLIVVFLTRYISLGSIVGSISLPFIAYLKGESKELVTFAFIVAVLIISKHKSNIKRLLNKKENKFKK